MGAIPGEALKAFERIHAAAGFHLWSETYDRKLDDVFKVQDEIAGEVVKQLQVTLLGATPKARTTDPKAWTQALDLMHSRPTGTETPS